jgi:hypothetical protein
VASVGWRNHPSWVNLPQQRRSAAEIASPPFANPSKNTSPMTEYESRALHYLSRIEDLLKNLIVETKKVQEQTKALEIHLRKPTQKPSAGLSKSD